MALLVFVVSFLALAATEDCKPDSEVINLLQRGDAAKPASLLSKETAGWFNIFVEVDRSQKFEDFVVEVPILRYGIEVDSANTRIEDFKAKIQRATGRAVQSLMCDGKLIENGHTLADYNIHAASSCQVTEQ